MVHALIAALTMLGTDIIATIEVKAEAADRGWLAGLLDAAGWILSITTLSISVGVLAGHSTTADKAWVIGLVTVANVLGTKIGQVLGSRLLKSKTLSLIAGAARSGR